MGPQEKADCRIRSRLMWHPLLDHRYEAIETLRKEQGGKCALCDAKAVVLDHCHGTGLVRGMLCRSCNLVDANSNREGAREYFTNPPARGRWLYVHADGRVLMVELGIITSHPHSRALALRLLGPETA